MSIDRMNWFPFLVGLGILLPMFFTMSGGIYTNKEVLVDSGGVIEALPLPISILTCWIVITLYPERLRETRAAWAMILGVFIVSMTSLWFGGDGVTPPNQKLTMAVQVALPMLGLLIGKLIPGDGEEVALAYLVVLTIIMPLQLFIPFGGAPWDLSSFGASQLSSNDFLSDNVGLFTIYAHIQYVSLIFVCALAYAVVMLFNEYKLWLFVVSVLMLVYVMRSFSYLTMTAYLVFLICYSWWWLSKLQLNIKFVIVLVVASIVISAVGVSYLSRQDNDFIFRSVNTAYTKIKPIIEGNIPSNVEERFGDWELFGKRIIESPKSLLVGHPEPMPREVRSSPHNWYLDIAHTFGLIGLLPILVLIGFTARICWRHRNSLPMQTWWLAGIVFYLVIVDNNFKVTLRQPYPGIFAFFMWGILLTRLESFNAAKQGGA